MEERKLEKKDEFTAFVAGFRKIHAMIPSTIFDVIKDRGYLRGDVFDGFVTSAIYEKLVSLGDIEASGSVKPKKKRKPVAVGEIE